MLTFIAFVLTILGCVNWLLIGLLQYDFIAGLFGYQASIFSRMIYILFGIGAIYLTLRVIINKGTFKVYEKKKKRSKYMKKQEKTNAPAYQNVEAGEEQINNKYAGNNRHDIENYRNSKEYEDAQEFENDNEHRYGTEAHHPDQNNLFDEHFEDKI